jgi:hypothetical protein
MTYPLGLSLELFRKGSRMTAVYDPSLGSFLLAEQLRSGKVVIHERLDALAMLDIDLVRAFCLCAGAAWTSSADLAASPDWQE